jgi:glycosyltransferase involved in cell wall biosynthesis
MMVQTTEVSEVPVSSDRTRPRVLLIAEAANPEWVSVPLVGWNIYQALAKIADVHLVTHIRNRDAVKRAGLTEGNDFSVIDNEYVAAPLYRLSTLLRGGSGKGWTTVTALSSLAYYSFEFELWRRFKERLVAGEFDIVHRVTPLSPTSQSILAKRLAKRNIPFVVGPLNGGVPWPRNFIHRQHAEREWLSHIRSIYKLMPAYQSMRRYSSAILVGSKHTLAEMPLSIQGTCVYIPENGIRADQVAPAREPTIRRPLVACFVGRLVPYKGADMLLQASAEFLKSNQLVLHIVGDGPERASLEEFAKRLGVGNFVHFDGLLNHDEVLLKLRECDFMVFPSIREFGGGVVIEAMAMGATPIVADYAGPGELVDEATGIRVAFVDRNSLVDGLRSAIGNLIENPNLLDTFAKAARQKVIADYTWEAKAAQIKQVYDTVLAKAKPMS